MKADSVGEPRLDKHLLELGGKGGKQHPGMDFDLEDARGSTVVTYLLYLGQKVSKYMNSS